MKETIAAKIGRVLRSIAGAVMGENVRHAADHVRTVRGINLPDIC